jgi:hypothetical protein
MVRVIPDLWKVHGDGRSPAPGEVVAPDERLSWPRTVGLGAQHVIAMFGATYGNPRDDAGEPGPWPGAAGRRRQVTLPPHKSPVYRSRGQLALRPTARQRTLEVEAAAW